MDTKKLAYAAAVFDCRGSILLVSGRHKSRRLMLQVHCYRKEVMECFVELFGGTIHQKKNGIHGWQKEGNYCLEILDALFPYLLTERKIKQIKLIRRKFVPLGVSKPGEYRDPEEMRKRIKTNNILQRSISLMNRPTKVVQEIHKVQRRIPTEEDFAYLAGVLDVKGAIRKPHQRQRGPIIDIRSNYRELIVWINRRFTGKAGIVKFTDRRSKGTQYYWRIHVLELRKIIDRTVKYMNCQDRAEDIQYWQENRPLYEEKETPETISVPSKWGKMFS